MPRAAGRAIGAKGSVRIVGESYFRVNQPRSRRRRTREGPLSSATESTHPLRVKLARGVPIAGIWSVLPSAQAAGTIAAAGFDFAILDCEHGGFDFATLEATITACETAGASPLVRAPGADGFFIQRALDLGADGIVVPQIPDADSARRAVRMAHFAPIGTRGYNPYTRGGNYGMPPQPRYAAGYPFTGVLIESPAAAEQLSQIVAIPELDLIYLGVFDYSVALGIPGQVDDPRVQDFVARATDHRPRRRQGCRHHRHVGKTDCAPDRAGRQRPALRLRYLGAVERRTRRPGPLFTLRLEPTMSADRMEAASAASRYRAGALVDFARSLLQHAGLREDIASDVAEVLVDGDLLGHTTHGLALLSGYLGELEKGTMARDGAPKVVGKRPAVETWDGGRLPGPWLTLRAFDTATTMAATYGTGTVVIRRSHHIACLAAYLKRVTDQGMMALLYCSDPSGRSVAPFGGVSPVFTPNPMAAGIPTSGDPILLDISASCTTNGLTNRLYKEGGRLPHPWVQDAQGNATDDPAVLFAEPKGTLLPLGGLDVGHKGYALALLIEACTGALAGHGRADPSEGWGATVFAQVFDPAAFGGAAEFNRQTDWLVNACHEATPRPGGPPVRVPGENGMKRHREQTASGVALHPSIAPLLEPWAAKFGVAMPGTLR